MELEALFETRLAATVNRYHSERLIREQSVGEHSYNVACLCNYLAGGASANLLTAALHHDVPEFRLGDAPAPVKWHYKDLKREYNKAEEDILTELDMYVTLNDEELCIIKVADSLECALYSLEEYRTGNRRMISVCTNALSYMRDNLLPTRHSPSAWQERAFSIYDYCWREIAQ